ncbi:MAG: tetratricopeptide repeat protein [Fuerstiella sp.]|jgi:tetratricopeptide (TPR) repeat protein|nr:tetratricopeptide repeat protein [Fuerstiella sp.]
MTDPDGQPDPNDDVQSTPSRGQSRESFSRWRICFLVIGVAAVACAGRWYWSIESGLEHGQQAAARGHWNKARDYLDRYLSWHPEDAAARLLIAEALVRGDVQAGAESVDRAIAHLARIDDDSPLAAKARLQQARLSLLILQQPAAAEALLKRSLELETNSPDANILMWKLLDVTGRHIDSRDYFWRAYEVYVPSARPSLLRDWFLAEFYPESANSSFHNAMGARAVGKLPASISLLVILRESEPEAHFLHAALASYYLDRGQPKSSLELLKETPDLAQAMTTPFFVSVLFQSLVDLGETEKAKTCFKQFPRRGATSYLYLRSKAMFHHYVQQDAAAAVAAYEEALSQWPAKFDWGLLTKQSECLRKVGRTDEAEQVQERVTQLTTVVLTEDKTNVLRDKLRNLNDPDVAGELAEVYTEFGLKREAVAWREHQKKLLMSVPSLLPSSTSAK